MKKILTIAIFIGISLQAVPSYAWQWDPLGAKKAAESLGKSLDNLQNIKVTVEHSLPLRTIKVAALVGLGITLSISGIYMLLQKKESVQELPEDLSDEEYVYARCTQLLKKAAPYLKSAACLTAGLALIIYSEKLAS